MLPQTIIIAIFATLISQGNIAYALPQGPANSNTNSERLDGRDTTTIDARAIDVASRVDIANLAVRRDMDSMQLEARELEARDGVATAGLVLAAIPVGGMVYGGGKLFFTHTQVGKALVKSFNGKHPGVKIKTVKAKDAVTKFCITLCGAGRHTQAKIEAVIGNEGDRPSPTNAGGLILVEPRDSHDSIFNMYRDESAYTTQEV